MTQVQAMRLHMAPRIRELRVIRTVDEDTSVALSEYRRDNCLASLAKELYRVGAISVTPIKCEGLEAMDYSINVVIPEDRLAEIDRLRESKDKP